MSATDTQLDGRLPEAGEQSPRVAYRPLDFSFHQKLCSLNIMLDTRRAEPVVPLK